MENRKFNRKSKVESQTLEQEIGDVAVYGIQQYEQSHSKESSAVNLNVTMSVSPQDNKSTLTLVGKAFPCRLNEFISYSLGPKVRAQLPNLET